LLHTKKIFNYNGAEFEVSACVLMRENKMLRKLFRRKEKQPLRMANVLDRHLSVMTKSYRIKNAIFSLSVAIAILFMGYRFVYMEQDNIAKSGMHIAKILLKGAVSAGNDQGSGLKLSQAVTQAMENVNAKAILIEANSGGGSPVQAEIIQSAIMEAKLMRDEMAALLSSADDSMTDERRIELESYNKPIVVVMADICASACYFAVSQADRLISHPSSLVGSIGVRIDAWQFSSALEQFGVSKITLKSAEDKTLLDPFEKMTDGQRDTVMNEMINPTYEIFMSAVREARGDKLVGEESEIFSGRVFVGYKAKRLGLIDEVSTINKVMKGLETEVGTQAVVEYNHKKFSIQSIITSSIKDAIIELSSSNYQLN
jgi:protease-4